MMKFGKVHIYLKVYFIQNFYTSVNYLHEHCKVNFTHL